MPQLQCRSQVRLRSDPLPGNSTFHRVAKKKKKKKQSCPPNPNIELSLWHLEIFTLSGNAHWKGGFFCFVFFPWLYPWHVEVPGPGIEPISLQCDLSHSSDNAGSLTWCTAREILGLFFCKVREGNIFLGAWEWR